MPPLTLEELTLGVFSSDLYAALEVDIADFDHPHPRARIRDAVVQRLRAATTEGESGRVQGELATALELESLPMVLVYTPTETEPKEHGEGPREIARSCSVAVDVAVSEKALGGIPICDVLDAFGRCVELLLLNDRSTSGCLSGRGDEITMGAQALEIETAAERQVFHLRMGFLVTYVDELAVPVTTELEQVNVQYDLAPPDGVIDAEDEIHPEQ